MRTRKKILLILLSFSITGLISSGIAFGCSVFGFPFWPVFVLSAIVQIGAPIIYERFYESKRIFEAVDEYRKKPYKQYMIELNCAHCGHKNEVPIDLNETEFRCTNCQKFNGIHINFVTAAIHEPIA